ncbi:carbonic anhydrase [Methylococcus sp. Mc7]|uniref:carbonic anhydrase n=1 Tax=Methylococcus sp. Mc7 TaxID=2860258 RepID=UPI001C52D1D4|nr:carbonic anhydrase [Methylococcus sp. Mc7]QXP85729.1 carbonic anhydrase [Methylococcus sp. Mc7]
MQKLIQGLHHFQTTIFGSQRELFERLAQGQSPEVLFITCSDSRINPNLITQTEPGELFILRNAGNIVPPYGAGQGGEAATIEFAVAGLGVKDIIVCGHSHCGAMKGLLEPPSSRDFPALTQWLSHAESTRRIVRDKYAGREGASLINVTIQENVLAQMENLRTHPVVASGLAQGKLKLHGWVYKIETGQVFGYDPESSQFRTLTEQRSLRPMPERKLVALEI